MTGAEDTITRCGLIIKVDQAAVRDRDHTCGWINGETATGSVGEAVGDGIGGAIVVFGACGDTHQGVVGGVFTHGSVVGAADLTDLGRCVAAGDGSAVAVGGT